MFRLTERFKNQCCLVCFPVSPKKVRQTLGLLSAIFLLHIKPYPLISNFLPGPVSTFLYSGKKALMLGSAVKGLPWSVSPCLSPGLSDWGFYHPLSFNGQPTLPGESAGLGQQLSHGPSLSQPPQCLFWGTMRHSSPGVPGSFPFSTLWLSWPSSLSVRFDS